MSGGVFIQCPACGHGQFLKEQEEAKCISCGNIIKRKEKSVQPPNLARLDNIKKITSRFNDNTVVWAGGILAILALVITLTVANQNSNKNNNPVGGGSPEIGQSNNLSPSASEAPDNMEAFTISQNFVKDNIVSPATADFPYEATNIKCVGNKYIVVSYVDAQNSYGAKIRERYMSYQIYNGGGWSRKSNWTLMSLIIGDDITYTNKSKTAEEIAGDIDYLRTH